MNTLAWILVGCGACVSVCLAAITILQARIARLRAELVQVQKEAADAKSRLADMVATVGLLVADDPALDDLERMSTAAAARPGPDAGGHLSEVEQRAVDRILGPRPAR